MTNWKTKYRALDDADKLAADIILNAVLDTMGCKEGAIVMLADPKGDGSADFYYGGNALLVEPLLDAGMAIGKHYFECEKGTMQ